MGEDPLVHQAGACVAWQVQPPVVVHRVGVKGLVSVTGDGIFKQGAWSGEFSVGVPSICVIKKSTEVNQSSFDAGKRKNRTFAIRRHPSNMLNAYCGSFSPAHQKISFLYSQHAES